ncbi:MAG: hypothetical protein LBN71_00860, partial [Tannerella sp.]|nr:hypothetical protein [Tannerella sp.]
IVSDSLQQLHYYAFDGTELYSKDITTGYPWQTLLNLAYYDHALWAVTENLTDENRYEKWLYKLDTDFQLLTGVKLANADLGRFHLDGCLSPELMVMNKGLYVYSPSPFRETILADTLYLVASGQLTRFPSLQTGGENPVYTVPLHVNERFMITSYQANVSEKENYLFCYDRRSDKVYDQNGLKDDFYQTGVVGDLQALDIHSREYYFYKSGKDIAASFPKRSENDNPVLFFVKLIS